MIDWIKEGNRIKAKYVISVCDTFSYEDYPVYVSEKENLDDVIAKYDGMNMQIVNEVITLKGKK